MRGFLALVLTLILAVMPTLAPAQTMTGIDWQLLAIDGIRTDAQASLRIEEDGAIGGQAPCNRWSVANGAVLPALALAGIRATRMACDRLDDEQVFFDALSVMTALEPEGDSTLILTGPDGRSMEFVRDATDSAVLCFTCAEGDGAGN
jgi:heat shock protein HslJ